MHAPAGLRTADAKATLLVAAAAVATAVTATPIVPGLLIAALWARLVPSRLSVLARLPIAAVAALAGLAVLGQIERMVLFDVPAGLLASAVVVGACARAVAAARGGVPDRWFGRDDLALAVPFIAFVAVGVVSVVVNGDAAYGWFVHGGDHSAHFHLVVDSVDGRRLLYTNDPGVFGGPYPKLVHYAVGRLVDVTASSPTAPSRLAVTLTTMAGAAWANYALVVLSSGLVARELLSRWRVRPWLRSTAAAAAGAVTLTATLGRTLDFGFLTTVTAVWVANTVVLVAVRTTDRPRRGLVFCALSALVLLHVWHPIAAVPAALAVVMAARIASRERGALDARTLLPIAGVAAVCAVFAAPAVLAALRQNDASMVGAMQGSIEQLPGFVTVAAAGGVAIAGLVGRRGGHAGTLSGPLVALASVAGVLAVLLPFRPPEGGLGYYHVKLLYHLVFLAVPVAMAGLGAALDRLRSAPTAAALATSLAAAAFVPLVFPRGWVLSHVADAKTWSDPGPILSVYRDRPSGPVLVAGGRSGYELAVENGYVEFAVPITAEIWAAMRGPDLSLPPERVCEAARRYPGLLVVSRSAELPAALRAAGCPEPAPVVRVVR